VLLRRMGFEPGNSCSSLIDTLSGGSLGELVRRKAGVDREAAACS
jgi:hypothetical protein